MTDEPRDSYRKDMALNVNRDFKALYGRGQTAVSGDKEALAILWAARLICDQLFELKMGWRRESDE